MQRPKTFLPLTLLALAVSIGDGLAQTTSMVIASFSSDTELPSGPITDEGLAIKCATSSAGSHFLPSEGWRAWFGDIDGDGIADVPGDIDALLIFDPDRGPVPSNIAFSLLQDEGPFEDGDILTRAPDGRIVAWKTEAELRQALGTTSTTVDVDATTLLPDGTLLFSLASDLSSSNVGPIQDGDVLSLDPLGNVSIAYREDDLQIIAEAALGAGIGAVLDCIALAQDPLDSTLVFVVQSPSAHDATAIRVTRSTVSGFTEVDWGFQRAAEIDALAFFRGSCEHPAWIKASPPVVSPRTILNLEVAGGTANGLYLLLFGATPGEFVIPGLAGMGAFTMDPLDPLFLQAIGSWADLIGVFDGAGTSSIQVWTEALLPVPFDLQLQVVDLADATISSPTLVQIR